MANETTLVNGVTKREVAGVFTYFFPKAVITVDVADTTIDIRALPDLSRSDLFLFASLTDNFGTATAEGYVDYLATNEYFFDIASGGGGGTSDVNVISQSAGLALESKQDVGNAFLGDIDISTASIDAKTPTLDVVMCIAQSLSNIEEQNRTIIYLLKGLNE